MSSPMSLEKKDETSFKEREGSTTSNDETEIDLYSYHEHNAGRLIIDPAEAKVELGEAIAARLKLSSDGSIVLWPQPTDSDRDPQNWSPRKKDLQLLIITLAAIVPDFDSGIGIACIFALAEEYGTTTGVINNLTSNWSIFLLGWGGLVAVMLIRRLGRLPVLFWSQVLALGFLVGCTFAPNLKTFAAMRCLTAFFGTAPQVTGLYTVTDLYPFHIQARKLNFWSMGFLISPFLSPFAFGFLVARINWRWAYGIGSMYSLVIVLLIAFFLEETIYDRNVRPIPEPTTKGLRYRFETVIGITGWKMQKYRVSWRESILSPFKIVWRPHILLLLIFEALFFGFGTIGVNVTLAVFLGTPADEGGFGWSQYAVAASYATPMVSVLIGEISGRYFNDYIMNLGIKRNHGVFEAETRLWATYAAIPIFVAGFVLLGAAIEIHLHTVALVIGWGLSEIAVMVGTVSVYAYCSDAFPKHQGEISSLLNLTRVLGGFSVAYFQLPWAEKYGALQSFGCEAAIIAGVWLLAIPVLQWNGRSFRAKYSLHK